jgi:HCOMODA/2-hydroxy-3-carboxy-muconic semialdehyde decarboxylase
MSDPSPQELVSLANRMLVQEGVLDAFGHASLRDPENPERFFLSRSLAPERVTAADVLALGLDGEPISPTSQALYSERVIHAAIYRLRPDVMAICHHHAAALMPFCLADIKLSVVSQLGAVIGTEVPLWDQRDEFGATNHLVTKDAEAVSLAKRLGDANLVLMKRHGATVVGRSLRELVFRSVYACRNAELQLRAMSYGPISVCTPEEIDLASRYPESTLVRAWDYWHSRLRDV